MTRPTLLCIAAVAALPSTASGQSTAALTLDEAVRIALARNSSIQSAALAEARADEEVGQARTRHLPAFSVETQASRLLRPVDLTFPAGAFGSFPSTGPVPSVDTTVTTPAQMTMVFNASVSQPVTGLLKARLGVQQSEHARALAREDTRAARLAIVAQVKHTYYAILEAMSALEATEANGRLLAEPDRVVANRVVQRVALRADGLDVKARLAQNAVTQTSLQHRLASSKEQLNQLLGRDVESAVEVAPIWETLAASPADNDNEPARRPDVQQATLRAQQAALAVRQARVDSLPDVNLLVQTVTPVNIDGAPRNITSAGVQVKWEPFDWGRKARVLASKQFDARRADRALADAVVAAHLEINRARRAVEQARVNLRAASLTRDVALEQVHVRTAQYQSQAVLLTDVLQAQASHAESSNQYQRAVLSLLAAQADLDLAIGEELNK
jgi:outer membrane protein TolC